MSEPDPGMANNAAAMQQAFDRTFAEAPRSETALFDDFLAIRLGADPHLVALADIARLLPHKTVTRLPSRTHELLGVAGIAGAIIPVYDLRALLGYPTTDAPRWMLIAAAMPIALAFDGFDGQFRHPRDIAAPAALEASRPREVLRIANTSLPVVSVASILATIKSLARDGASQKER